MELNYRLEISSPADTKTKATVWEFTPESGRVVSIESTLKIEHHRISTLVAKIHDPDWSIFNSLPDPAYADVPIKLFASRAGSSDMSEYPRFDGKVTELQIGYPAESTLTVTAHDKSVDARKEKQYRTLRGLTSVQLARQIAKVYGFSVDASTEALAVTTTKAIHHSMGLTDWDFLGRALSADGLELHWDIHKKAIVIRKGTDLEYPTRIVRGQPPVVRLEVRIMHIGGPGKGGDVNVATHETGGTELSVSGILARAAKGEKATKVTHRMPIGIGSSTTGAHSEDARKGSPWSPSVDLKRKRKDTATLTCPLLPDLTLSHRIRLEGWGGKVDGLWEPESVRDVIAGNRFMPTTIELRRPASKSSSDRAGLTGLTAETHIP